MTPKPKTSTWTQKFYCWSLKERPHYPLFLFYFLFLNKIKINSVERERERGGGRCEKNEEMPFTVLAYGSRYYAPLKQLLIRRTSSSLFSNHHHRRQPVSVPFSPSSSSVFHLPNPNLLTVTGNSLFFRMEVLYSLLSLLLYYYYYCRTVVFVLLKLDRVMILVEYSWWFGFF